MNISETKTGLRILITNNTLSCRAGSELYVRDIALALLKRGHNPMVYSTILGDVAEELRQATVPVLDDLNTLNVTPDLIHGQHHLDAMTAFLHFPHVPALFFCHGWLPWQEMPPVAPSIVRYLAVDDLCKERLLITPRIAPNKIKILRNFVNLDLFKPRIPLPQKPFSALIFSNYASESNFVKTIRAACLRFGIKRVDVAGIASGNVITEPYQLLLEYDVVFAKARCALEAMAVGCAVIVADFSGLGGMVTTKNVEYLRRLNFGVRTMQRSTITEETIYAELLHYHSEDAAQVSTWIREEVCMEKAITQLEQHYAEVVNETENIATKSLTEWTRATSSYLNSIMATVKNRESSLLNTLKMQMSFLSELKPNFREVLLNNEDNLALPSIPLDTLDIILAYIDKVQLQNQKVHITGWACDGQGGAGCMSVLAMLNNQVIADTIVSIARPDVQQARELISDRAGFELIIPFIPQQPIQLFAISLAGQFFRIKTIEFPDKEV